MTCVKNPIYFSTPFFLALSALTMAGCGRDPNLRGTRLDRQDAGIVAGRDVKPSESVGNSVVALVARLSHGESLCTGSIIAKDTVLTAAHCVDEQAKQLVIVFSRDARKAKAENIRRATSFEQNPRWQSPRSEFGRGDLAVVHFEGGLPSGYEPIKIAPASWTPTRGDETMLVGYGVTNGAREEGSGKMRETWTTILGSASQTEIVTDGQKASVCFGDSGGPALVRTGKTLAQWGIASAVMNKGCDKASIHTNIAPYASWIKATAAKLRR
jgi:hypothetical protein